MKRGRRRTRFNCPGASPHLRGDAILSPIFPAMTVNPPNA